MLVLIRRFHVQGGALNWFRSCLSTVGSRQTIQLTEVYCKARTGSHQFISFIKDVINVIIHHEVRSRCQAGDMQLQLQSWNHRQRQTPAIYLFSRCRAVVWISSITYELWQIWSHMVWCTRIYIHIGHALAFLTNSVQATSTSSTRSGLWTASTRNYVTSRLRIQFGERAFTHAGPAAWNALPTYLRAQSNLVWALLIFRRQLITHFLWLGLRSIRTRRDSSFNCIANFCNARMFLFVMCTLSSFYSQLLLRTTHYGAIFQALHCQNVCSNLHVWCTIITRSNWRQVYFMQLHNKHPAIATHCDSCASCYFSGFITA